MNFITLKLSKVLPALLLFILSLHCTAQHSKEELLTLTSKKDLTLEQKVEYLCELSCHFRRSDTIKAYQYAQSALTAARNEEALDQQAIAYEALADVARYQDNVPLQVKYADSSYLLAVRSRDPKAIAYAGYAIAYRHEAVGITDKYIYHMLKSLAYFEKQKIRYDKLVNGYENLGASFSDNNDLKFSRKYNKKALELSYESHNAINIANASTSWALFLVRSAEQKSPADPKLLKIAESYYLKAIYLFEKEQKKGTINASYGRTCLNLSNLYLYHFFESQPDKTLFYLNKAKQVCMKINVPVQLMVMYGQQAQFYTNLSDIPNIEKVLQNIEMIIAKNPTVNSRYRALLYKNYMDLAELKNDFSAYRKYFEQYDKAVRVMTEKENRAKEYNASVRFETEKKSQQIAMLQENLSSRQKINYLFTALLIFVFFTFLFMLRSYHYRQKSYIKNNLLLQKANEEAILLSKIKEEETVIAVLESELMEKELRIALQEKKWNEEQNNKLQQKLMTNNLQLDKKNEVLKDIKTKLSEMKAEKYADINTLAKTIDRSMEVDEEFELLKTSLENTNPVFFSTLKEKASGTLTKLDYKYCGYIKLGLSTKEIANLMNIEPQSMRMARYRIKQKLNLDRETDLDSYITSLE